MLNLPDVTLVTVDTVCHELAALAIHECTFRINFGGVKVFSDRDIYPGTIDIPSISSAKEMEHFVYHDLLAAIETTHILFIQWDSWVIDPFMWTDEFLKYDYIGAPWWYSDNMNVGNSGFSLRSKSLMQFLADNSDQFPISQPEDHLLCRRYQPLLPQFKWAPEKLASSFAFERSRPAIDSRHFGFHGMFNWPFILPPAKLAERMKLVRANPYIQKSGMIQEIDDVAGVHWHRLQP